MTEDELGLGHGPFHGVHEQQDSVHHVHHSFHFTAEVGVAWSVDNIDFHSVVVNGGVLGQDGDSPLPFQVIGIHDPFSDALIFSEDMALFQHRIHEGGFPWIRRVQ